MWSKKTGDDQVSLIDIYRDEIISAMKEISLLESEGDTKKFIFFEQEYCAGFHNCDEYIKWKKYFTKYSWIRMNQSPKSPLFNVNYHFYFRKLSKAISSL